MMPILTNNERDVLVALWMVTGSTDDSAPARVVALAARMQLGCTNACLGSLCSKGIVAYEVVPDEGIKYRMIPADRW